MNDESKDPLGDRMKGYEMAEAGRRLMPYLPVLVRIDGKRFSRFTQGLKRPYDARLSLLMGAVTKYLVSETSALAGYTQSDEISLLMHTDDPGTQLFLDRRIQKLTSILASMTTAHFNALLAEHIPEKAGETALFDCRVWNVPTREEAANAFLWRERDATKNSISMAAREYFSHAQLHGKSGSEMQEMLFQSGVNWNDYPDFFKRGRFVLRKQITRKLTAQELDALPPLHNARKNPSLPITRHTLDYVIMPPFSKVTNRAGVLFEGEDPRIEDG